MEKVLKIKVKRGGTQGAEVVFTKREQKSGVSWENSVKKNFTWPVQGKFRKIIEEFGEAVADVLNVSELGYFIGTGFELKPEGYVLTADRLYEVGSKVYAVEFKSFPINEECGSFEMVHAKVKEAIECLKEYGSTQTTVNTKQLVLDLVDQGKLKLPKELDGVAIEEVEDQDLLNRFRNALEKRGMVVIDTTEMDKNPIEEPEQKKKIRVA